MDSESQFDQLARRDADLSALASRGRRRSLVIMMLAFVPSPFVVMALNNDHDPAGLIPIGIACVVAISYSWTKWQRRPEDSQSIAFVGLDRKRRWATYRSMLRGTGIDDPVVITILESINDHLRRSVVMVVATTVLLAGAIVALVEYGGDGVSPWIPATILVLAAGSIAGHRWIINRSGLVVDRSQH
jgi:hypothetical protein